MQQSLRYPEMAALHDLEIQQQCLYLSVTNYFILELIARTVSQYTEQNRLGQTHKQKTVSVSRTIGTDRMLSKCKVKFKLIAYKS